MMKIITREKARLKRATGIGIKPVALKIPAKITVRSRPRGAEANENTPAITIKRKAGITLETPPKVQPISSR